jgi:integrase
MARGRVYTPGKRVPGERNVGIIATAAGSFESFVSYGGRRFTAGTHATLEEARDARDARLRELQGGGSASSLRARRVSFAEFFEATFFPETYTRPSDPKRASTLRAALSRYATYLRPYFGHRALADITYTTITTFIGKLAAGAFRAPETVTRCVHGKERVYKPRRVMTPSAKTRREVLLLLRSALTDAVLHRHIRENPFPPKSIPSARNRDAVAEKKKRETLSPKTILAIVGKIPSLKHRTIATVLAYAGLRLGECLALQWGDVDFRRGFLSVVRSADAKTREVGPPKTPHSIRDVPLDPALAKALRTYRASLGRVPAAGDWMFPSERQRREQIGVAPIIDQRVFVQRYFEPARKKMTTERITPHTLRHLWCSTMVTRFPVADVSVWAGHHSPSFTYERYVKPLERTMNRSPITTSIYGAAGSRR